jgi:hypothetical protein
MNARSNRVLYFVSGPMCPRDEKISAKEWDQTPGEEFYSRHAARWERTDERRRH